MPKRHTLAGGGDARKAHVGHSKYGESLVSFGQHAELLSLTRYQSVTFITSTSNYHPLSPLWIDMPKRHTLAGQNIVSLETVYVSDIISLPG